MIIQRFRRIGIAMLMAASACLVAAQDGETGQTESANQTIPTWSTGSITLGGPNLSEPPWCLLSSDPARWLEPTTRAPQTGQGINKSGARSF